MITPETAGVMAQVLAVLLLATAFAPEFRGHLANRIVRDVDGEFHIVPTRKRLVFGGVAWARIGLITFTLIVVFIDCQVVLWGEQVTGWLGVLIVGLNGGATASGLSSVGFAVYNHASDSTQEPANKA